MKTMNVLSLNEESINMYLPEIIELYRKVFSESVWQEGLKCSDVQCDFNCSYSNTPDNKSCVKCKKILIDFYSKEEIEGFVKAVFDKKYYQAFLGIDSAQKVNAFTWGWVDNLVSLNDEKLGLSEDELQILQKGLSKINLNPEEEFYYQSETGVTPESQGKGIGKSITSLNQEVLEQNQSRISQILQRTSRKSPMFNIREKQGYKVVYDYGDIDERVLFAKDNSIGIK